MMIDELLDKEPNINVGNMFLRDAVVFKVNLGLMIKISLS